MGISFGRQKSSKSESSYGPEMWVPGQKYVARGLKEAIMPIFGTQFGTNPTVRTLAELARSGASKDVGATINQLSEMRGLSQPALAKITAQLPTQAMEAAASVYQQLYAGLLELGTKYGLTPAGTAGTSKGSGGGGLTVGAGLMGGGLSTGTTNVYNKP